MNQESSPNCEFRVKVIPKTRQSVMECWDGELLIVKLRSVPEKGKANKELVQLLRESIGLPKASVEIKSGKASRLKTVSIHGISKEDVEAKFFEFKKER